MRWIFWTIISLVLTAIIYLYATRLSDITIAENALAHRVSLGQTTEGLLTLEKLGSKAMTIAVDKSLFGSISQNLRGQKIMLAVASMPDEPLSVIVEDLDLSPSAGRFTGKMGVRFASEKRLWSIKIDVDVALYFAGITEIKTANSDTTHQFGAVFRLLPTQVSPDLGFLDVPGRWFVSSIITGNVIARLADILTLTVPYPARFELGINENSLPELTLGKSKIKYKVVQDPPFIFRRWVNVIAPIFSDRGVVLAAALNESEIEPSTPRDIWAAGEIAPDQAAINERVGKLSGVFSGKHLTIDIRSGALSAAASELSADLRKVSVKGDSTEANGRFFSIEDKFGFLGGYSFYAQPAGGDRLHVTVGVSHANLGYAPGTGISGSIGLNVVASGDIKVHVDPVFGGGAGTTAEIHGSTSIDVSARIASTSFKFEGSEVALVGLVPSCSAISIHAQTNGKFQLKDGWATVPKLGAKVGWLIGDKPLPPFIVTGPPTYIPILETDTKFVPAIGFKAKNGLYARLGVENSRFEPTSAAYRIASNLTVGVVTEMPDDAMRPEERDRLNEAARNQWRDAMSQNCPEKPPISLDGIGKIEFGSETDILRYLKGIVKDLPRIPGDGEVQQLLDRLNPLVGNLDEEGRNLAKELGDAVKGAFPNNSGVRGAADRIATTVNGLIPGSSNSQNNGGILLPPWPPSVSRPPWRSRR